MSNGFEGVFSHFAESWKEQLREKNSEKNYPSILPRLQPTIKCSNCGHDTGLNPNGFLMAIPPEGLKCACGTIIINGPNIYW